jgi:hypothetical protein
MVLAHLTLLRVVSINSQELSHQETGNDYSHPSQTPGGDVAG